MFGQFSPVVSKEKITRRKYYDICVPPDDKTSHVLWPGELKMVSLLMI